MTADMTEREKAYNEGFYGALKGVVFATKLPGSSLAHVRASAEDAMNEMLEQGLVPEDSAAFMDGLIDFIEEIDDPEEQRVLIESMLAEMDGK